jgi:hypothetical protein
VISPSWRCEPAHLIGARELSGNEHLVQGDDERAHEATVTGNLLGPE